MLRSDLGVDDRHREEHKALADYFSDHIEEKDKIHVTEAPFQVPPTHKGELYGGKHNRDQCINQNELAVFSR